MDPLTHGIASFALQRAFWPRAKGLAIASMLLAGILPDIDWFSAILGPSAYLGWHRAVTHSLVSAIVLAVVGLLVPFAATVWFGIQFGGGSVIPGAATKPEKPGPILRTHAHPAAFLFFSTYVAAFASVLLHLTMDVCQSDGVALFWPFSHRRFALDLVANLDPWLLAILVAAILLPELFRLVGEEIGARNKRPRGRNGAMIGFAFVAVYITLRSVAHGNAVAALDAHTIAGEMPRRAAAFPDSTSPLLWHGIVETESAINLVTLRSAGGEVTDATGVTTLHKPEPSPILSAAQNSPAAMVFVKFARFPKATVVKETAGYSVEIQDLQDQAAEANHRAIFADITLDKNRQVVSSQLQWRKSSSNPR